MIIAVEGCAHGELDTIYDTISCLEAEKNIKVDLLICCGDFQSSRNEEDLLCMAVPMKYCQICTFYKYYSGEKKAPILTIFIGGNHEASNYLQELPYGGWVAPNIYYLGYAGVINVAGVRIGGISGIYKGHDYLRGHFEMPPYSENTKRSVYHQRNLEVFRLKQLSQPIDIFLSHDWPAEICNYGNSNQLVRFKPHFKSDIESGQLGSKPCAEVLNHLQPKYWFAAHLHCKFAAIVPHENGKSTKFLALDKCLPRRRFLQIIDIPHDENLSIQLAYDLEWLTILHLTNHLLSVKNCICYMPGCSDTERWNFTPTEEEKNKILSKFDNDLTIPENFSQTSPPFNANHPKQLQHVTPPKPKLNPQTKDFCNKLAIDDPLEILLTTTNKDADQSTVNESYVSDNQTFVETDHEASLPFSTSLGKLVLPEPKLGSFVIDGENGGEHDLSGGKWEDEGGGCGGDNVRKLSNEESDDRNVSPRPKKLVRRNADIYKNDCE